MLFRQEMEAEELRISSESALKELQQLQVSYAFRCLTRDSEETSEMRGVTLAKVWYFIQGALRLVQKLRATFSPPIRRQRRTDRGSGARVFLVGEGGDGAVMHVSSWDRNRSKRPESAP